MKSFFKFLNWLDNYFWHYIVATNLITVLSFIKAVLTQAPGTVDIILGLVVLVNALFFAIFVSFYGRKHLKEKEAR